MNQSITTSADMNVCLVQQHSNATYLEGTHESRLFILFRSRKIGFS